MKKFLKKITVSLMSALMLFSSTYATLGSVSATDNDIQPRGNWYVYGDVNNDGDINVVDVVAVGLAISKFQELTGDSILPLSYAVARPEVYGLKVPYAADIDGNNYITENDRQMLMFYVGMMHDKAGRCGQPFFIN